MKTFARWLSRILIWAGPLLVLSIVIVGGFLAWALGTQQGTRWTLGTAAHYMDGRAEGVRGSILGGVHVEDFAIRLPELSVEIEDFHLQADWRQLLERRLHVKDLSAGRIAVGLKSSDEPASEEPAEIPAIPVQILLDRLALGRLEVTIDGEPLPVGVSRLETSLAVTGETGQLVLRSLDVAHELADVSLSGDLRLAELRKPWPARAYLDAAIQGKGPDSPLCLPAFVPGSAPANAASGNNGSEKANGEEGKDGDASSDAAGMPPCAANLQLKADGSLDAMAVTLTGSGQGLKLLANASLLPQAAFPLRKADVDLELGDGSGVQGELTWNEAQSPGAADRVTGTLSTRKLNVGHMAAGAIPDALLTLDGAFDIGVHDMQRLENAEVSLAFAEDSRWNGQVLSGKLKLALEQVVGAGNAAAAAQADAGRDAAPVDAVAAGKPAAETAVSGGVASGEAAADKAASDASAPIVPAMLSEWRLPVVSADLRIGRSRFVLDGALGDAKDRIKLDAAAPSLDALWPGLPGGFKASGELGGSVAQHAADLQVEYTMPDGKPDVPGSAPVQAVLALDGGWGRGPGGEAEGWRGRITRLRADHAGFRVASEGETPVSYVPGAQDVEWRIGEARLQVWQREDHLLTLRSRQAQGGHGRWESSGEVAQLRITDARIERLRETLAVMQPEKVKADRGGVTVRSAARKQENDITLDIDWNLKFSDALEGVASVRRTAGDLVIPADTPVPMGLRTLGMNIKANRVSAGVSRLLAEGQVQTADKGSLEVDGSFLLRSAGGWRIDPADGNVVQARAVVADLGWISIFTGDAVELGGKISADVKAQSRKDGSWGTGGNVSGEGLRIVSLDQGVRLLDGTLRAHFDNDRVVLDSLRFPAQLRVEPKEWRTREWVYNNPDAKDGSLTLSGEWNLAQSRGVVDVALRRYPILQRSDRYAMISGDIKVDAQLPALAVTGSVTADAGWIDLDIVGGVPSVDGDVVVVRGGEAPKEVSAPMDVSLDLTVDLGPRFYLTGYGVNSGLIGQMRLVMKAGKLTAHGALNTRGGAIETYGQRLQLRRGTITFQGDITSPVLDIEALRTGAAVQAGVRVAGTARRPRIDLVSYPEVAEVEKLSWLLLGRGPDESGGDAALLFSVGTSFLSGGEPFYRRFGIDEVSMRSGELGAVGSILPAESVVRSLDSGTSEIERKFMVVSKTLSSGFTVSVEQALSDTGTVGRVSYRLARGLTAQASAGTVSGLALVYRYFSRD